MAVLKSKLTEFGMHYRSEGCVKKSTVLKIVSDPAWLRADLNSIQVFGKDIRAVLVVSCQKVFFEAHGGHDYYHYGPIIAGPGGTANRSGHYLIFFCFLFVKNH